MLLAIILLAASPAQAVPCSRDAMVQRQVSPDYPASAREAGLGEKTVAVRVYVTPDGSVAAARVIVSSTNGALDQAALSAAVQSSYTGRIVKCKPAYGTYIFKVTFAPNQ